MSKSDEINVLLNRSKKFMLSADLQMREGMYDLAVFSIEQALQLFLKAKLLENGVDYPKTHSIRRLLNMLAEVAPEQISNRIREMMNKYIFEFGVLEDAYISSRYTLREYLEEEVKRLRELAEEVMRNIG